MICELELLMKDWTSTEKQEVYDKVDRLTAISEKQSSEGSEKSKITVKEKL